MRYFLICFKHLLTVSAFHDKYLWNSLIGNQLFLAYDHFGNINVIQQKGTYEIPLVFRFETSLSFDIFFNSFDTNESKRFSFLLLSLNSLYSVYFLNFYRSSLSLSKTFHNLSYFSSWSFTFLIFYLQYLSSFTDDSLSSITFFPEVLGS